MQPSVETPVYVPPPSVMWYPQGTEVVGETRSGHALIVILGRSGVGKSHLGRQLLLDPDYGKDEVLFLMAENATATYNTDGIHIKQVKTFNSAMEVANELARATAAGKRLPKVIFVDSVSGMADYQRQSYKAEPKMVWSNERKEMVNDKRAEFGDLGYTAMDVLIRLRDDVAADVVATATTFEGAFNAQPEIAVEGRLLPKNITRLSAVTLYMKALSAGIPDGVVVKPRPHRTIVPANPETQTPGQVINRYFFTQDVGEVMAKGHHMLSFQEPAYLPDVLRKIHGAPSMEKK